jgi:Arc/MetJ family transcription regulator
MRMKIDIDEQLIREAMQKGGYLTKSAAVEAGLRLLLKVHSQADIRELHGKVKWEGNLDESRLGRNQD